MAWTDKETGVVGFEPVGTVPDYRRRGLSRALLSHVFSKYHKQGFRRASIRTGSDYNSPANYLYRSLQPMNTYKVLDYSLE